MIYLNSFFDQCFTQRVLVGKKIGLFEPLRVGLAPRGEFSKGALNLKKGKKKLYIALVKLLGLYKGITWQATTERERYEIQVGFPPALDQNIEIVGNLASSVKCNSMDQVIHAQEIPDDRLRVCFLSRISPKKNLEFALRVFSAVKSEMVFTVYGPIEVESYFDRCKDVVDTLPSNVEVCFAGSVPSDEVYSYLAQHEVFLFPTLGENYGHVIVEALSAGLFTIVSDQTPWSNLFEAGVGATLPLSDLLEYARILDECATWSRDTWLKVRQEAARYAERVVEDVDALEKNRQFFYDDLLE